MKKLVYLSIFTFFFFGCKKEEPTSEVDVCETNYNPLTIGVSTYGSVKHPVTSYIFFTNSETSIFPMESTGLNSNSFDNISVTIDGGEAMTVTPDYGYIIIENGLNVGTRIL